MDVPAESPAAAAGLEPEDRLLAIDGTPIQGLSDAQVHEQLSGEVGSFVTLTVLRQDETLELRVKRVPYRSSGSGR